jgi:hypothetical protein
MTTPCMTAAENLVKLFVVIQPGSADVCHPKENRRPDVRRFAVSGISRWQLDTICAHLRIRYARCYRPTFLGDRAPSAMIAAYSPSEIYFNSLPLSRDQRAYLDRRSPGESADALKVGPWTRDNHFYIYPNSLESGLSRSGSHIV